MKYKFWPLNSSLKGVFVSIALFWLFAWATDLFSQSGLVQIMTFAVIALYHSITQLERNIEAMRYQVMTLQDDIARLKDGFHEHREDYPSLPSGFDDA